LFIRPYLKRTDQTKKGWRTALGGKSTCLGSMTLSVQIPVPPPEKIGFQEFWSKPFEYAYSHVNVMREIYGYTCTF
jgi:hypothetical protein